MKKKITTSLKELYTEALICEMPLRSSKLYTQKLDEDVYNYRETKNFISGRKGKLVGKFKDFPNINIYTNIELTGTNKELLVYYLIDEKTITTVGFVKLLQIKDNNIVYFSTYGIWQKLTVKHSNIISSFLIKWLLPEYKIIISDNSTSDLGERFWLKIAKYGLENNKECGIFILENLRNNKEKQFEQLYKIEDFSKAWNSLGFKYRIYIKE